MNKRLETALYTTRSPNDQEAHEELPSITTHDRNTKETTTETLRDTHSHMRACRHTNDQDETALPGLENGPTTLENCWQFYLKTNICVTLIQKFHL